MEKTLDTRALDLIQELRRRAAEEPDKTLRNMWHNIEVALVLARRCSKRTCIGYASPAHRLKVELQRSRDYCTYMAEHCTDDAVRIVHGEATQKAMTSIYLEAGQKVQTLLEEAQAANFSGAETIHIRDVWETMDRMRARTQRILGVFAGETAEYGPESAWLVQEERGFAIHLRHDRTRHHEELHAAVADLQDLGFSLVS